MPAKHVATIHLQDSAVQMCGANGMFCSKIVLTVPLTPQHVCHGTRETLGGWLSGEMKKRRKRNLVESKGTWRMEVDEI